MNKSLKTKIRNLTENEIFKRIKLIKETFKDKLFILGHHYQRDEVIQFADATGDSLKLSKLASTTNAKYIVFCGVSFMAETASILNPPEKTIILPDISAGCPMADMVRRKDAEQAFAFLNDSGINTVPVSYINIYADVKAFCGEHNGYICTSSNAEKILGKLFKENKKVLFMPDRNLGVNTARKIGIKKSQIYNFRPKEIDRLKKMNKNELKKEFKNKKLFLMDGYCPVHERFKVEDVEKLKKQIKDIKILVHPEVTEEVAQLADYMGSTEYIIKTIASVEKGSKWGIATDAHLVGRLAKEYQNQKEIYLIGSSVCMCSMMDRTSIQDLLYVLENLNSGRIINEIRVGEKIKKSALTALNNMMEQS